MIRVLVASRNESDNALIQKKLVGLKREFGAMSFSSARPANLANMIDPQVNLLVYNCPVYTSSLKNQILQWRNSGYVGPAIVILKVPRPKVLSDFDFVKNLVLLEKPYDQKDLMGIAQKFLRDRDVNQRKFRRFETKQTAHLESYQRDFAATSHVENISRGGINIKGDLRDMSKGDLLRVNMELDQLKKSYSMSAKVVWTAGKVGARIRSAGLQFMTKEAVYNYLLNAI